MVTLNNQLSISDFREVLFNKQSVALHDDLIRRVEASFNFLKSFSKNKVIYGVNTGFGPMAQYRIEDKDAKNLQKNLIRSHASGQGQPLQPEYVKALMLARLNTLSLGKSGIHLSAINTLQALINNNLTPLIFEHGGVGASGDLVQLAHLALVLIGEGEIIENNKRLPTQEVYKKHNISAMTIHLREGLGLMNGTSAMTGIGIVNCLYTERLLEWSTACSAMINEIVEAYDDHLSPQLNAAKQHKGQIEIAKRMREHLSDSQLTRDRNTHLYNGNSNETYFKEKVQEYYSLRCVPQILGPVYDTVKHSSKILVEEVNSANDNPIVDVEEKHVYHGGNFHGDYVALEMDKLKLVVTKLTMLAERQINYLLNDRLNNLLPPFVNMGTLGLNFGMQGIQFPAVSTTAENQALSTSLYIHSIPNNNDNQDIVSMGTNAALMTKTVINNAFEVLTVELMTIIQALHYLDIEDKLSSKTKALFTIFKSKIPKFDTDQPQYKLLEEITTYLKENDVY